MAASTYRRLWHTGGGNETTAQRTKEESAHRRVIDAAETFELRKKTHSKESLKNWFPLLEGNLQHAESVQNTKLADRIRDQIKWLKT